MAANRSVGVGRFVAWDGGCLFIGRHDAPVPVHAHQAIQLVVGRNASPLIRAGEDAPWLTYSAALIPSRQTHGINVTMADYGAVLFVEPETKEGRAIAERYLRNGIADVGGDALRIAVGRLFDAWHRRVDESALAADCRAVVGTLSEGVEPSVVTDERITRAVAFIGAHLASTLTLDQVASHVYLSPSRFRHLFAEQTGMALRPYILWRRFLYVWNLLMRGETLSSAAHAAGFADAAHLTRTSKRMFGFAPSGMQLVASPPRAAGAANDAPVNSRTAAPGAGSRTRTGRRGTRSS